MAASTGSFAMFQGSHTKTGKELAEMQRLIEQGLLPKDAIDQYYENQAMATFGENFKVDKQGNPIEQGIGSKAQPSRSSIDAYIKNQTERRHGGPEPGFDETVARMEAELTAFSDGQPRQKRRYTRRQAA
jgi:hypothetical protein